MERQISAASWYASALSTSIAKIMAKKQIRVVASANSVYRRLLGMTEKPEGSVYVRLYSGLNAGLYDYDTEIREHRFSLHPSPGLDYSVMNRHTLLKNGTETKIASRVSAIKTGKGFSPVFFCRFTDLTHPLHDMQASKGTKASNIFQDKFNFNHKNSTIFLGLFVGSTKAKFEPRSAGFYEEWVFEKLKVLILAGYSNFPSTPFGRIGQPIGLIKHPDGLPEIAPALSSSECEDLFRLAIHSLQRCQLQEILGMDMPDEMKASMQLALNNIMPPVPSSAFNLIERAAP
jgi:hypothetical protein